MIEMANLRIELNGLEKRLPELQEALRGNANSFTLQMTLANLVATWKSMKTTTKVMRKGYMDKMVEKAVEAVPVRRDTW